MKITDLEPRLLTWESDAVFDTADSIGEADGIMFMCPACFIKNQGPEGTHSIICWTASVPQTTKPSGARWSLVGNSLEDISLIAGDSAIRIKNPDGSEHWNGMVIDGDVLGE